MRARFLISACLVASMLAPALPAAADSSSDDSDAYVDEDDNPTVVVVDNDDPGPTGDEDSTEDPDCVWEVVIEDDLIFDVYNSEGGVPQHSATGRWLQKVCDGTPVAVGGRFLVPEGGIVDPEALAREAIASIGIDAPTIRTSPDAADRLYVRVPTWLWVDGGWWHGYQATASAGRVTATVTARPATTTWVTGDGDSTICAGPGVAWQPHLDESDADCTHTYTVSSTGAPEGTFDLQANVRLEVTWTSNVSAGGTLPAITRTSTRTVEVGEIQAIGTR